MLKEEKVQVQQKQQQQKIIKTQVWIKPITKC